MIELTPLVFVLPIVGGALLAQALWRDRQPKSLFLKAFLGIGLGLGARSVLYFVYLLLFAGQKWFIVVELSAFLVILAIVVRQELQTGLPRIATRTLTPGGSQSRLLASIAGLACVVSLLSTANYILQHRQGDWDAWMIYNRTARFLYFDQTHWLESFSPQMDFIFHADYPLLIATNVCSGWELLGTDTAAVPMLLSALFAISCAGLMGASLALAKSSGHAALGLIMLWGIPTFVTEGASQMADVPLAFYVLATGSLLFIYVQRPNPGLLVLAGLTAGFAAWTKNEGTVLVVGASLAALIVLRGRHAPRRLAAYAAGLAGPIAVLVYFKIMVAPPGDIVSGAAARLIQQLPSLTRHVEILQYSWQKAIGFGSWGIVPLSIGIIPILLLYYIFFRSPDIAGTRAYFAGYTILAVQLLGYYVAFLVTPNDLTWQLSYSTGRLVLQIFPLFLFLILCASVPAESVLGRNAADSDRGHHTSDV